jgi:hypothetical protein
MKFYNKIIKTIFLSLLLTSFVNVNAGNEDRAGSAGATELLINPWARSAGWADAAVSSITGLEAMFTNVAGLAYADKTEIMFARTNWMGSISGIGLNSIGLAQRVGETSVIGISVVSMNFGDVAITTTELPEGGIGNFSPKAMNFTLAFAKQFSSSISGGLNLKVVSNSISNTSAQGVGIDAGIRYVTGENDNVKFAISLKNVGPPMSFTGDGLSIDMLNPTTHNSQLLMTSQQRVSSFELPSQLHIGASYDFLFNESNTFTLASTFTSNSFAKDQLRVGGQYTLKSAKAHFIIRGGLVYEKDMFNSELTTTALAGPTGGFTVDFPMGENGTTIGLDYCFRPSILGSIHTVGGRINLGKK